MPPNESQIERLRPWVEAETGMDFTGNRIGRLHDCVQKVLSRDRTPTDLDRLLGSSQQRGLFLERLTAELTVGESFFFRNEHHFRALREHVLPEILRDNREQRQVRAWSAGCAGGEEPYSLAILLDQVLCTPQENRKSKIKNQKRGDWSVSILGTDLNPEFLERARQASYRPWSFRHTAIQQNAAYFSRSRDTFQLAAKVRDLVRFAYLNLVKDVYPSPLTGTLGLDLILFRNVAIYLKPEVTQKILERFHQALRPGGWLLLGETEVSLAATDGFSRADLIRQLFIKNLRTGPAAMDRLSTPTPVLVDFVTESSQRRDAGMATSRQQPAPLAAPSLPDWVPLPSHKTSSSRPRSGRGNGAATAGRWPNAEPKPAVSAPAATGEQYVERLLAERKFDEAERAIERIANKKQRARSRFRLAQELLASAAARRARQMLDRCLRDDPLMIEVQLLQASFAEEAGNLSEAEQAYRRALYIDRKCPMAHFHLALVLQQKGDVAGTRRSVHTTLKLIDHKDPHELVEYGEGVCYGRLKEMANMILDF